MLVAPRYLNRELLAVVVVVFVLVLFVALGGRLIGYLQEAAIGRLSSASLLTLIGLRIPEFAQLALPFALVVALLMTLGRLYAEQEAAVFAAAGAGPLRLLLWCLPVVVGFSVLVGALALYVTPQAAAAFEAAIAQQRLDRQIEALNPGAFHALSGGKRVTYAEAIDGEAAELSGVFIADFTDERTVTIWAEKGSQRIAQETGSSFLMLSGGERHEGVAGLGDFRIVAFDSLAQRVAVEPGRFRRERLQAVPTVELMARESSDAKAELHWRIALPLFALIGAAMAVAVARVKPRQGRFARLAPGVLLLVIYYLVLVVNLDVIQESRLPQALGLWPAHGLFAALALILLRRASAPAAV